MISMTTEIPDSAECLRRRNVQVWTPPRLELKEALLRVAPYLAELYEGAVLLLYECPVAGRARLIAHAVREIGNALPEKITGKSFPTKFDPTNHLDDLVSDWEKYGLSAAGFSTISDDSGMDSIRDGGLVHVPRSLLEKLAQLIKRHEQSRATNRDKAVELFKACDSQNPDHIDLLVPVLKQWLDVVRWFVGLVHDRKRSDNEILQGEFLVKFEIFESGLRAITTDFFGTATEELDEILENANF
jgi:hypothetical protein